MEKVTAGNSSPICKACDAACMLYPRAARLATGPLQRYTHRMVLVCSRHLHEAHGHAIAGRQWNRGTLGWAIKAPQKWCLQIAMQQPSIEQSRTSITNGPGSHGILVISSVWQSQRVYKNRLHMEAIKRAQWASSWCMTAAVLFWPLLANMWESSWDAEKWYGNRWPQQPVKYSAS